MSSSRHTDPGPAGGRRPAALAGAAIAYAVAIAWLAWPISADPASRLVDVAASGVPLARWTEADRDLTVWVLGWTARAVATAPLDVFHANIFHPAPDALASSENLLGLLPVSGPTFLLTGNPVLTHNLTLFASLWASALLTMLLVRDWSGSSAAGFLAGAAFAFAPHVTGSFVRLHVSAVHFFPLVALLAVRAAGRPRWWNVLGLAAAVALQILAGLYVAYQLAVLVAALAPAVWWEARRRGSTPWPALAALGAGFLVLLPLSAPYLRVRARGMLPDFESARAIASALAVPWQVAWQRLAGSVSWPVLALAVVGAVALRRERAHLCLALVAAGAVGFVLSLGPAVPLVPGTELPGPYAIAMHVVPGFASMRAPGRFLVVPLLCACVLAGLGAAELARLAARVSPRVGAAAALLAVLAGAGLVWARKPEPPLVAMQVPDDPSDWDAYRWLAEHGDGKPVLELPAMVSPLDLGALVATGGYLIGSTLHGLPLLNGYSGHAPPTAQLLLSLADRLPEPDAFRQLCDLVSLGWLVVHLDGDRARADAWTAAEGALGLARRAELPGPVRIYAVGERCGSLEPALLAQLSGRGLERSLRGTPLEPLDADGRRGRLDATVGALPAQLHAWVWVEVTNESDRTWPGLTLAAPGAVVAQSRFRDPRTGVARPAAVASPLGVDLAPGESTRVRVGVQVPPPGEHVLEIGLAQEGSGWLADLPGGGPILRLPVRAVPLGGAAAPDAPQR